MKIIFSSSDLMDSVKRILQYVSGKQTRIPEDYYRYVPCSADATMLSQLLRESIAWLSARTIMMWEGASMVSDTIEICFKVSSKPLNELHASEEFKSIVKEALQCRIIFLWLRLAGWDRLEEWDDKSEQLAAEINRQLRLNVPLRPRRPHPY